MPVKQELTDKCKQMHICKAAQQIMILVLFLSAVIAKEEEHLKKQHEKFDLI